MEAGGLLVLQAFGLIEIACRKEKGVNLLLLAHSENKFLFIIDLFLISRV